MRNDHLAVSIIRLANGQVEATKGHPLYTMVRNHKHGNLRALKTYPKVVHPMEIQKWGNSKLVYAWVVKCDVK